MTARLADLLRAGAARLRAGGIEGAARDARWLLAEAAGLAPERVLLDPERRLGAAQAARFEAMLDRRLAREPVARILGRRAFWGREFAVTPAVLDPRPETESLIAAALEGPVPERLLDLGTGAGILAVTLLAEWPGARAIATDIDPACLEVARENAARHGVADRLRLLHSDWFAAVEGGFDLIVSNPPYIAADELAGLAPEVRAHDPARALSPGGDGLAAFRAIAAGAAAHLAPGGRLLVEIGWQQGPEVAALFAEAGLSALRILPDLDGRDRVVVGQKPAHSPGKPM